MKHLHLQSFLIKSFGKDWYEMLKEHLHSDYFYQLGSLLNQEKSKYTIYPSDENMFRAFRITPFNSLKGVILGQDPYHDGSADGLCFSNSLTNKISPSLMNIFKELQFELDDNRYTDKDLSTWAVQGILMLNTALTVRKGEPDSHSHLWKIFTSSIIQTISEKKDDVIWMLWGSKAQFYKQLISNKSHGFVCTSHPSPLGAYQGETPFMGSRCFSDFNYELSIRNKQEIIW